ncbi:MAG: sigma-54 dependent transcriptional regulator [Terriglobia bacterium]
MCEKADIRVWFYNSDENFSSLVGRNLGPDFDVKLYNCDAISGCEGRCDCALLDLRGVGDGMDAASGLALVGKLRENQFPPPVIVLTGDDDAAFARAVLEAGAFDILASPLNIVELRLLLRRAHRLHQAEKELFRLRAEQASTARLGELIGYSENMQSVFALARKVAPCDVTVLVTGETGTGKTMLARSMHCLSSRAPHPFISFSCANLPENLVEDELFGHEKGAFTGAIALRRGRFEAADQGTLFMDEIGDLPLGLQAKLLRILHERTFERLGSNASQSVNIRLIGATHRNLEEMVKRGEFREDIYYRLNVVQLHLPPLRERAGAVPLLAHHFMQRFSREFSKKVVRLSPAAAKVVEEYPWPGNVRELENAIQRAVVLADGPVVEVQHLPAALGHGLEEPNASQSYEDEVRDFKRRLVLRTLRECGGNKTEAARVLGLARGYLHRLINELEIQSAETCSEAATAEEQLAPVV